MVNWTIEEANDALASLMTKYPDAEYRELADMMNDKKIPLVKDFVDEAVATFWQLDKYDPKPCSCPISQAIRYQILAIEADGRYTGVNATIIDLEDNQYIVFKDSNDKVMKPCTFY